MDDLSKLREEIDSVDKDLVRLFEKRMEYVLKIAEYKKQHNLTILHKTREEEVIKRGLQSLNNKNFEGALEEFLNSLMKISKELQNQLLSSYEKNKIVIGFQGVPGSFSEEALIEYFGDDVQRKAVEHFEDVFIELKNGKIDYGVLPIENSSTGAISEVYDLLNKYDFYITGEVCLKVAQNLLGIKGAKLEDIEEVYSHPQGFSQCSEFLKHCPSWTLIPYLNTAKSAEYVKKQNNKKLAAIGSKRAAKLYGLDILKPSINFNSNNTTKFVIISRDMKEDSYNNKISVVFSTSHKVGSLYNVLRCFAENYLNLLKIESRPLQDKPWEYFFYVDFEGNLKDETVQLAIEAVKNNSRYFKILGNYKKFDENY
ncbi:prephenate dehydratase [Clostridium sp. SYSU_GA19001]|uniref:prephenate dehydratase n=1 Tax=Clostridium caldaquaticum TaxID=2940653 RepID=UPI002077963A|nr:prephenate dehydratase [Clostridium caldaquaticum]MCM8711599.1 prephenate dehydratase [Clostridium caldaquaticum]